MPKIFKGRYTAETDEPFVVFIIGMRVNNLLAVRKWWPTAAAMGKMLRTLYAHPEKGFMHRTTFLYWRGIGLIQYWRSFEDLERFARSPSEPHLENWQRYNRVIGSDGSVGFLARVLPGRAGQTRRGLRQHAAFRACQGDRARTCYWKEGNGTPASGGRERTGGTLTRNAKRPHLTNLYQPSS